MSFSLQVKEELYRKTYSARHCNIALLSAFINISGSFTNIAGCSLLKIHTENYLVAKSCFELIQKVFNVKVEIIVYKNAKNKASRNYILIVPNVSHTKKIISSTSALSNNYMVSNLVISSICCKRAYIKGTFMALGYLSNPTTAYHAEFVFTKEIAALQLQELLIFFELNPKILKRKEYFIVYLKDSDQISDLLNIMEAHSALMELENIKIVKDVRNDVNRRVNFEAANLNKIVNASVLHIEAIKYILDTKGLSYLSEPLEEVARLRLLYENASLNEIGLMLSPPVGKSGVNHRFRKIIEIANRLKDGLE